ncbi:hypothetical protein BO94DRAFT_540294 [Aspergillus sclerotioniger CBS 115572]|uniref:Uncharacterized protein n=1 Tax=Aspergillus sclerotioniger CBS 115572 TaxID=1450535 RepID=A0A317V378_9EURO|nr:hypothetical protein BO94DRAFT_540294 [Aspergillus sclerotioniger CBS 115572]PWY68099.1 hypothetical protein BO94DRAFT_540294 [Aspergillus sclerotioniger CBS 115572]
MLPTSPETQSAPYPPKCRRFQLVAFALLPIIIIISSSGSENLGPGNANAIKTHYPQVKGSRLNVPRNHHDDRTSISRRYLCPNSIALTGTQP